MIVRSISILEQVESQLNNNAMRLREWYEAHFPELSRLIPDNKVYSSLIAKFGSFDVMSKSDLSDYCSETIAESIKKAALFTTGSEITDQDVDQLKKMASLVLSLSATRDKLVTYLENRMEAICPNFTHLLGARIGARIIQKAGSLSNLSKNPSSTVQIYGAESALFHAKKHNQPTPKYGILYHSALVGKAPPKFKGAMARVVANKAAICARFDFYSEDPQLSIGRHCQEKSLTLLEGFKTRELERSSKHIKTGIGPQPGRSFSNSRSGYSNSRDASSYSSRGKRDRPFSKSSPSRKKFR